MFWLVDCCVCNDLVCMIWCFSTIVYGPYTDIHTDNGNKIWDCEMIVNVDYITELTFYHIYLWHITKYFIHNSCARIYLFWRAIIAATRLNLQDELIRYWIRNSLYILPAWLQNQIVYFQSQKPQCHWQKTHCIHLVIAWQSGCNVLNNQKERYVKQRHLLLTWGP